MGGNAFLRTARLTRSEYLRMCDRVRNFMHREKVKKWGIPVQIKDKEELTRAYKGPDVLPYGDVDAIVGVDSVHDMNRLAKFLAMDIGAKHGAKYRGNGRHRSILSDEYYQVDLRYCFVDEAEWLVAIRSNNDFSGILGHLLAPYKLRLSDRGFMMKQVVQQHNFDEDSTDSRSYERDLLLSKDHEVVCRFLGMPKEVLDGETSFSLTELFEIIMKSNIYLHRGEFSGNYWSDERRAKRPMFQQMHKLIDSYQGQFEGQKDPGCRIRSALADYRDTMLNWRESEMTDLDREVRETLMASNPKRLSGDREKLEDFVFDYFGVAGQGWAARQTTVPLKEKEANFEKRHLFEWYPEVMDEEMANEVMRSLRSNFGIKSNGHKNYLKWLQYSSREEIRKEVDSIMEAFQ